MFPSLWPFEIHERPADENFTPNAHCMELYVIALDHLITIFSSLISWVVRTTSRILISEVSKEPKSKSSRISTSFPPPSHTLRPFFSGHDLPAAGVLRLSNFYEIRMPAPKKKKPPAWNFVRKNELFSVT